MLPFRRALVAVAHPDDESWLHGTVAAALREAGCTTALFCATDGEAWRPRRGPKDASDRDIAVRRRTEREQACEVLGLTGICFPGLPDGQLMDHLEHLTESLEDAITSFDPDLILTHDPRGEYGHPDHLAVHDAVRMACGGRDSPISIGWRLWAPDQFDQLIRRLRRSGFLQTAGGARMTDEQRVPSEERSLFGTPGDLLGVRITSMHREHAMQALACHASQLERCPPRDFPVPGIGHIDPSMMLMELFLSVEASGDAP